MQLSLTSRATNLTEFMDDPNCNLEKLYNTYKHFESINYFVSRWHKTYKKYLRPLMQSKDKTYQLLDVGFGGGDISLKLLEWAKADGINLKITAIDMEPRAISYVEKYIDSGNNAIAFQCISTSELVAQGKQFDFVISNHVLHHLSTEELSNFLSDAEALAMQRVIFNDLYRSSIAYYFFKFFTQPFFNNDFIVHDGLISIRRSFIASELKQLVPSGWKVKWLLPYRLLLLFDK